VVGKNGVGCAVSVVGCEDALATSFMWPVELDAGRLKPRPIKVGDRVTWGSRYMGYEVLGIHGRDAWLGNAFYVDTGDPSTKPTIVEPVSQLVKV